MEPIDERTLTKKTHVDIIDAKKGDPFKHYIEMRIITNPGVQLYLLEEVHGTFLNRKWKCKFKIDKNPVPNKTKIGSYHKIVVHNVKDIEGNLLESKEFQLIIYSAPVRPIKPMRGYSRFVPHLTDEFGGKAHDGTVHFPGVGDGG